MIVINRSLNRFSILFLILILGLAGSGCQPQQDSADAAEFEPRDMHTQYEQIRLVRVAGGLSYPWSLAFLPDGRMLVTELPGRLNIVDNDGEVTEISGIPEVGGVPESIITTPRVRDTQPGQGQVAGLTEVSVHPDYEENGWVYLTYSKPGGEDDRGREQIALAMGRGQLDGTDFINYEELFLQNRFQSPGRHYGSRIAWTPDGKLLLSIGGTSLGPRDAETTWPQDLEDHAGKILRLNDDGTVPDDNPFTGQKGVLPEIFSYGHRNIQGLTVDPETDEIWATEHGPRGGDELNLIKAGNNYGWPVVTRGLDYGTEGPHSRSVARRGLNGMVDPVYEFLPALNPSGLARVTADRFPRWKGNLLAGGLRAERIHRIVLQDREVIHQEELLIREIGRIRDVREGPDGHIYVVNDMADGGIFRIEPQE